MQLNAEYKNLFENALERSGLRATKQREQIFFGPLDKRDHPTADEIYARARNEMPSISLATVYNCLETLTESGLIRACQF
jgi:Fur family peroxide stress response transcriptional regulator